MPSRAVVEQLANSFQALQGVGKRDSKKQRRDQKLASAVMPNDLRLTAYLNNFKQFRAVSLSVQGVGWIWLIRLMIGW